MKKFTLKELAEITHSTLIGDAETCVFNVDSLESATESDVSFLANLRYRELLETTKAGVICIDPSIQPIAGKNFLVSDHPSLTFQKIAELFLSSSYNSSGFEGIHPTAVVHPSAKIGARVIIGPNTVIDQGVEIGDDTKICALVSIGPGVKIGSKCLIYPHVTIRARSQVGDRVILQPGAVIGSCGFGYSTDAKGVHTKLDQMGIVVIEDDVEIGANTTIDRARFKDTRICQGTKIDNLVQIAHNVQIGAHNFIISQTGIAGSSKTGKHVILAGQVGVNGHVNITDGVIVAAQGGVTKSITKPGKYNGTPATPVDENNRQRIHARRLSSYVERIEQLEKRLLELEAQLKG